MQKGEHEMNTPEEENCALVPAERQAQPAQEARPDWGWVEPAVWTDRLLKRLARCPASACPGRRRLGL